MADDFLAGHEVVAQTNVPNRQGVLGVWLSTSEYDRIHDERVALRRALTAIREECASRDNSTAMYAVKRIDQLVREGLGED